MEITESTKPMFYISRIFGYAPYSIELIYNIKIIRKNYKIYNNFLLIIYSLILICGLVALLIVGVYFDINSETPLRMKNATSKIVTGLDINFIGGSCLCGCICGILGIRNTQEMNRRLKETDETLSNYIKIWVKKDKYYGNILIFFVLCFTSILIILDIYGWCRRGQQMIDAHDSIEFNVIYFIPVYILYILLIVLQLQIGLTALGIGRRYRRLNIILSKLSLRENIGIKNTDVIERLAYTHESLGKAMTCVSNTYGITILVLLSSCLLHLVVTAYFFFIELTSKRDAFFSWVQFLWLVFHISRLIFLVETCHVTSVEACKTINIVCSIMRTHKGSLSLKKFWQQLLSDKAYFSACGMCKIDRQILTSISGACATYLVILIQFHLSSDEEI